MSAEYLPTLRYWFDVEAFMYPDLPKPGKRPLRPVFTGHYADRLPWMPRSANLPPPRDDHKYFVYFGLVAKAVLEAELSEMFRVAPQEADPAGNHQRPASGNTFLCALEVAADGTPDATSLQLAAFCVAFAARKNGPGIAYSRLRDELQQRAKDVTARSPSGRADAGWFEQVLGSLMAALDWQPRAWPAGAQLCVHTVALVDAKGKKLSRVPEMDPVNSFYLDDLERIRLGAELGHQSTQVQAYLDGHTRTAARADVTGPQAVDAALAAHRFPAGRWPSRFPLFLMQQAAVNLAMETLAEGGLFSVNGPPGTGKTTLLMDVIAARIVERAQLLAQFADPQQAFTRHAAPVEYPPNASGNVMRGACYVLDEQLLDAGIVVASANNKAVENLTLDLPSLDKVAPQPLMLDGQPFDYFAAAAESILNPPLEKPARAHGAATDAMDQAPGADEGEEEGQGDQGSLPPAHVKCWGLVSVPLGKKANRNLVAARLGRFAPSAPVNQLENIPAGELDWQHARQQLYDAVERVEVIQQAIASHDATLRELAAARLRMAGAHAVEAAAGQRNHLAQAALQSLDQLAQEHADGLAANLRERELLAREWPWWRQLLARLLRPSSLAQCSAQQQALAHDDDQLRTALATARHARQDAVAHANASAADWRSGQAALAACASQTAVLETRRRQLRQKLGTAAFDPAQFAALPVDEQQKCLPRSNASLHDARAAVFVAAMHLHKAFIKNAGKAFETNFRLALAMLQGEAYLKPHLATMAPHLWATFFLAVPVVSSTFASIARCFCDLGEGQIGLLLIDEAGQAVPSHALGALWRARRALMVGDPLQVEPVIKIDQTLDLAMLRYHNAPQEHLLTANSAQHLADRGNRHGANLVQYDGSDLWVGAPLRVHRRCADPMFSLSNQIAYNGTMVFGPPRADEVMATLARPLLGPSRWIDLPAGDFEEHYSAAEGQAAVEMVRAYADNGWLGKHDGLPDLFLISPFKSVADGVHHALRACSHAWAGRANEERIANWLKDRVGTVHTFQGKECETVLFILGGKTAGARHWAGSRPNIINVAVTRARRRLYVIGNRQAWSQTAFGRQLAEAVRTSAG